MHVIEALGRLGGVADSATLIRLTSQKKIRTALERGDIVRAGRRGYALANAEAGLRAARALNGVSSHLSAAGFWKWETKTQPERPAVIVPRNRKVEPRRRVGVDLRWRQLPREAVHAGKVTSRVRTVLDCARDLPFDEALAVADSALRHGDVTQDELTRAALDQPTTGRKRCLRVAHEADGRAANPFESVLRAIALDAGLRLVPQVTIADDGFTARPDLVDVKRRLVVEADSFEFHGGRNALHRDCRRYTALALRGWTVLRFSWEDVMLHPEYVRSCFVWLREGRLERAARPDPLDSVA